MISTTLESGESDMPSLSLRVVLSATPTLRVARTYMAMPPSTAMIWPVM